MPDTLYADQRPKQNDSTLISDGSVKGTLVVGSHQLNHSEKASLPRLKIALVTETWPPEINGVALSMMQLARGLQRLGHEILLIRPNQNVSCQDFTPNQECLVYGQKIPSYPDLKFGWPQLRKIKKSIQSFQPDIVHIVTEGPLGLAALYAAKAKKIPVSSGFHSQFHNMSRFMDMSFLAMPIQHYLKWFHNATQLTCVPSVDTEKELLEFGVTCPLKVVGRGIDTERFNPERYSTQLRQQWGVDEDTTVIVYVGRLSKEKEIDVIWDAYLQLKQRTDRKFKLVLVGDGPDRARLAALKGADDVVFTGGLSGTDLAEAYASANVFAFASCVETFGNVVLEAMASGLPVIAYDYACAQLYVEEGVSGWLPTFEQVDEFKNYLLNVPENKKLNEMGVNAMQRVQHSGWHQPVEQFEQALFQAAQFSSIQT